MKAITLHEYGSAEDLRLVELPEPKVAPGEVLVKVKAAGINPVDWKLAAGGLDALIETRFPLIPGWDVAGIVERVGFDAGEFAVGDEVLGYIRKDWAQNGSYAEYVSASVRMLAHKPAVLNWEQAAGLPLAGLTAFRSLRRLRVTAADTVLIHAAAGGVGSLGTQIAVAWGARVIGTASERNHEYLRSLGAEPVVYGPGLADRVRAMAPAGIDAALDFVGDDAVAVSQRVLKQPERVVSIADASVESQGGQYVWVRPDAAELAELTRLAQDGRLTVNVDRSFPLAEAAAAWRESRTGHARGKITLTV